MKKGLDFYVSIVAIALLASIACRQHERLKRYADDVKRMDRMTKVQAEQMEDLKDQLSYYEQPGDGILSHGNLKVEKGKLIDCNGQPLQLRGISSHGLTWFPRYTNAASLGFWKEAGANVFRASMYTDQNRGYIYYPEESQNYLYLAVENALANDMYVIIDWHILYDANPLEHMEKAKDFFKGVASHYGGNPGIIYEICNEPNGDTTWEDVTEYAHEVIPLIRKYAPEAIILVGMPNYCTDYRSVLEQPLSYENIMYTYHQYVNGEGEPYDAFGLEQMLEHELPVFISEWGIGLGAIEAEGIDFHAADVFLDRLEKEGISWVAWALSNKNDSHALIRSDSREYGDFSVEDLSEVGRYVYNRLRAQTSCIIRHE